MPTLDELLNPDWHTTRPQARHRAHRPGLRARTAATLAAARQAARDALRDALVGSGTPTGGLTLHTTQRTDGTTT